MEAADNERNNINLTAVGTQLELWLHLAPTWDIYPKSKGEYTHMKSRHSPMTSLSTVPPSPRPQSPLLLIPPPSPLLSPPFSLLSPPSSPPPSPRPQSPLILFPPPPSSLPPHPDLKVPSSSLLSPPFSLLPSSLPPHPDLKALSFSSPDTI